MAQELERLQSDGVIQPVKHSDWASPIVPVVKRDGSIRICGDFKITVNQVANRDIYPLPRSEDLFNKLAGGQAFSKLDLSHAYQQIVLSEESRKLVTINTPLGLFQYNRLPFGVSAAPAIFQRTMETLLQGMEHLCVYIDDISITGATEEEHIKTLDEVLQRLETAGVRLKQSKCVFMKSEVEFLGHRVTQHGVQPTEDKVRAVNRAPIPTNVAQLRSFLGLMNYYSRFLPNLSSTLAPLYLLLQKSSSWFWGTEQQKAFESAKAQLSSDTLLVYYCGDKPLLLSCDASSYGLGAVLSHRMEDGSEKPIAYASRTLAPAEKRYAQIEKEGLAIVFGVTKFRQYLLGREFTIISDHKPLLSLFSHTRSIPQMASARILRWALTLSAYQYTISFKSGKTHCNADGLSRLPLPDTPSQVPLPGDTVLVLDRLSATPVSVSQIRTWTSRDPLLSRVRDFIQQGWPQSVDTSFRPFHSRRSELSVQDGCLLWGSRVVIPPQGRALIMEEFHETHPGVSRLKSLARSYVWWPGMDSDLEEKVRRCAECQQNQKSPAKAPLHPWEWPERPWSRLHVDYAGPFLGKMFLVIVDAYSKWLEVVITNSATSLTTIEQLRKLFAVHGLPELIISDNGPAFSSDEFKVFMKKNGIRHRQTAPYHPSSNGLAERAVQSFKLALKKNTSGTLQQRLSDFLLYQHITPHTTTGRPPAELLMGRKLRSKLDLLIPDVSIRVQLSQERQKKYHDRGTKSQEFETGDKVFVKNHLSKSPRWLPGQITQRTGPLSYVVQLHSGRTVRIHVDQIRIDTTVEEPKEIDGAWDTLVVPTESTVQPEPSDQTPPRQLRRSTRTRNPPDRYSPSWRRGGV